MATTQRPSLNKIIAMLPILATKARRWTIDENSDIRDRYGNCPLCALAKATGKKGGYGTLGGTEAVQKLFGVSEDIAEAVADPFMAAADIHNERTRRLRGRIKRALGMQQKG